MIQAPHRGFWQLVEDRAFETPDALFAVDEDDRRLSFAGYRDAALRAASGLSRLGVTTDCAVSWMLPTWMDSLVLVAALARLGARQNPILPIYRGREVGFITHQSAAQLLIVPCNYALPDPHAPPTHTVRGAEGHGSTGR